MTNEDETTGGNGMDGTHGRGQQNGVSRGTVIRRRIGLGIALSSVLVVAGGAVLAGVTVASAAADDERSRQAVVEAAAALDDLPAIEPVVPADPSASPGGDPVSPAAGVDYSRTPEGWYDATTDPSDVFIPEVNEWGEKADGIWEAQQQISAQCMAEQGFWFAWTNDRTKALEPYGSLVLMDESEAAALAYSGTNPSDQPYDWQLAGCQGYAVHVTGMDDAH
ncbi:hypothetical protein KXS11_16765 [Plantibacter flavus]|uniref:hypothetical protein n=1 Tax=Plantibacter flavus TaxID=150123 RepID=UPI003F16D6CD